MINTKELIARQRELQRDSTRAGVSFLRTDVETALTFAERAGAHDDPATVRRNQQNALRGYDTVTRILGRMKRTYVDLSELQELQDRLGILKSRLQELGEALT